MQSQSPNNLKTESESILNILLPCVMLTRPMDINATTSENIWMEMKLEDWYMLINIYLIKFSYRCRLLQGFRQYFSTRNSIETFKLSIECCGDPILIWYIIEWFRIRINITSKHTTWRSPRVEMFCLGESILNNTRTLAEINNLERIIIIK